MKDFADVRVIHLEEQFSDSVVMLTDRCSCKHGLAERRIPEAIGNGRDQHWQSLQRLAVSSA